MLDSTEFTAFFFLKKKTKSVCLQEKKNIGLLFKMTGEEYLIKMTEEQDKGGSHV